jgi:predicted helicase
MALDVQKPYVNNFKNIFMSMGSGRIINELNPICMKNGKRLMNVHLSYEKGNLWMSFIQTKISNMDEWLWIIQYNLQFMRMDKKWILIV